MLVVAGTCAEGHDGAGRVGALRVLADVVEALQHPADGAVAAAHQDLVVGDVPEHVQSIHNTYIKLLLYL